MGQGQAQISSTLIYVLSSCLNLPLTPTFLAPAGLGVCGEGGGAGLLSLHLCSAWDPGNLGLEGKEANPKQEMLLWAPAAGGQCEGGGGRLGMGALRMSRARCKKTP